ncbi:MAG: 2,3-bisphosphoglycerate-independent phosphoglycerate mutase [Patescibacteria group bacterium]
MIQKTKPVVLAIMDGWGIGPKWKGNAVWLARTSNVDRLWRIYPHTVLNASGRSVGLPTPQPGNSEAGHMNMGAGRIVDQDNVKIDKHINDGTFFKNPAFLQAINHAKKNKSHIHIMGLLCNQKSAHADPDHLIALLTMCRLKATPQVFLHLFTDGRDSPPYYAIKLLKRLVGSFKDGEIIVTIMGRFYGMDRKKAWERTEAAYNAMVLGEGYKVANPEEAIFHGYSLGKTDEFLPPSIIQHDHQVGRFITDNDAIIFYNLRSDRARQMAKPFVQKDFEQKGGFKRKKVLKNLCFVAMTDFGPDLDSIISAFPSEDVQNTLPAVLSQRRQLYIAEKEKYAHITYFFNGGYANPLDGEDWRMVPSPDVASYDKKPEMSAGLITTEVLKALRKRQYDFVAINFANPDMVGHTGNLKAAIKAVETVDQCVGKLYNLVHEQEGTMFITADHGNADQMIDRRTGEIFTEHTRNPVPFILADRLFKQKRLKKGVLGDIAPTVLKTMEIKKAKEMSRGGLFR